MKSIWMGHRPGLDDDARSRDGGAERNDTEGTFVEGFRCILVR